MRNPFKCGHKELVHKLIASLAFERTTDGQRTEVLPADLLFAYYIHGKITTVFANK